MAAETGNEGGSSAARRVSKVENRKSDLSLLSSFEYERDRVGNPTSILGEDGSVIYYEYDAKHQLTRETQRNAPGAALADSIGPSPGHRRVSEQYRHHRLRCCG